MSDYKEVIKLEESGELPKDSNIRWEEGYDKQQRLSDIGFCMPPITIRPEIISKQEFIRLTTDSKEVAR